MPGVQQRRGDAVSSTTVAASALVSSYVCRIHEWPLELCGRASEQPLMRSFACSRPLSHRAGQPFAACAPRLRSSQDQPGSSYRPRRRTTDCCCDNDDDDRLRTGVPAWPMPDVEDQCLCTTVLQQRCSFSRRAQSPIFWTHSFVQHWV